MPALKTGNRVYLAGHRGLVGSAILKALEEQKRFDIVTRTHQELDLLNQRDTYSFLADAKPDTVIVAAAKVGGINAHTNNPADFITQNLIIQSNLIEGSHLADIPNLLFLGSSCIYPRLTKQPISEDALLSGRPEPTNAPYAVAKIAGVVQCDAISQQYGRNYFTIVLPNVFGPRDNYHPKNSHVIGGMIRRFHAGLPDKPVTCWGTGSPRREFLHSSEVADACLFLLNQPRVRGHINVGTGTSITVKEFASTVQRVVGHTGEILWDSTMPDGFPEKTNDTTLINRLGWYPKMSLEAGLTDAYEWYKANAV